MELTAQGFESLLSLLAPDREAAAAQYERVRWQLVRYFDARTCPCSHELTDAVIDRVARRLANGERIRSSESMRYIYGVAHNVLREWWKAERRQQESLSAVPSLETPSPDLERRDTCLRHCLDATHPDHRRLLLQYYRGVGRAKIEDHNALARQLGVTPNALRIRIHRLKSELQRCVESCMGATSGRCRGRTA